MSRSQLALAHHGYHFKESFLKGTFLFILLQFEEMVPRTLDKTSVMSLHLFCGSSEHILVGIVCVLFVYSTSRSGVVGVVRLVEGGKGREQTQAMSSLRNQVTNSEHFRLTPHHCFQTKEQVSNFKYQIQSYNYGIGSKLTLSVIHHHSVLLLSGNLLLRKLLVPKIKCSETCK